MKVLIYSLNFNILFESFNLKEQFHDFKVLKKLL